MTAPDLPRQGRRRKLVRLVIIWAVLFVGTVAGTWAIAWRASDASTPARAPRVYGVGARLEGPGKTGAIRMADLRNSHPDLFKAVETTFQTRTSDLQACAKIEAGLDRSRADFEVSFSIQPSSGMYRPHLVEIERASRILHAQTVECLRGVYEATQLPIDGAFKGRVSYPMCFNPATSRDGGAE